MVEAVEPHEHDTVRPRLAALAEVSGVDQVTCSIRSAWLVWSSYFMGSHTDAFVLQHAAANLQRGKSDGNSAAGSTDLTVSYCMVN